MRTFTCLPPLQDGSSLPWVWKIPQDPTENPIWGTTLIPYALYSGWTPDGTPIGDAIGYAWEGLLDPADTPLPDWITETTLVSQNNNADELIPTEDSN